MMQHLLLPLYQKLSAVLFSLEQFSKGQDLSYCLCQ